MQLFNVTSFNVLVILFNSIKNNNNWNQLPYTCLLLSIILVEPQFRN